MPLGEELSAGSVICDITTDKAIVPFEVQDDAVIAKYLIGAGTEVPTGTPVAIFVEDADDFAAFQAADAEGLIVFPESNGTASSTLSSNSAIPVPPDSVETVIPNRSVATDALLMPAASHLAASKGIDVTALTGTGRGGRITKGDILLALAEGVIFPPLPKASTAASSSSSSSSSSSPATATADSVTVSADSSSTPAKTAPMPSIAPPIAAGEVSTTEAPGKDETPSSMRKIIAKRLTESKSQVPHTYVSVDCELDALMAFRKALATETQVKVSVNDIIIRSAGLALRDVPEINASFDPSTGVPQLNASVDVSVAVATPGGLITPIVTDVDKLGLADITAKVKDLATRAKNNALLPHEFQGGSFTISNLGMFGVNEFSAVINPPQAVIMAVGGGVKTVKPGIDGDAEPRVATVMTARISCDRRVGDEAIASQFLQAFKNYMNKPQLLLM